MREPESFILQPAIEHEACLFPPRISGSLAAPSTNPILDPKTRGADDPKTAGAEELAERSPGR
eukprot:859886-Rhodomonas_salina.1